MNKGIRQLARQIKVSHTAIANAMKDLNITGQSQGQGKPTLLSDDEQARIAAYLGCSAALNNSTPTLQSSQVSIVPADVVLPVPSVERLDLTVADSSKTRALAMQEFMTTLNTYQGNGQSLEDALLQKAKQDGAELGTQLALAKLGTAIATSQDIERDAAKKLGLVKDGDASS